jgi:energy-coupling factor transport system substrate-specific component
VNVRRVISGFIYVLSGAIGVLAFVYPFFKVSPVAHGQAHGQDALLVTAALVGLSVLALLVEMQGQAISAKTVAMLGVLVAITSVLRFIEVLIPIPGGFSPVFAPIILAGYVFGARFGFLMGAFTLLTSALITGGVGPWLPYQMFTAGWAGMTAGWLGQIPNPKTKAPNPKRPSFEVVLLCIWGFVWGLLYGAIMNVYFWPLAVGPAEQAWTPGIGLGETLARYAVFYTVTSLGWDMGRAAGNVALILLLGVPTVRALTRFRRRFHFEVRSHA